MKRLLPVCAASIWAVLLGLLVSLPPPVLAEEQEAGHPRTGEQAIEHLAAEQPDISHQKSGTLPADEAAEQRSRVIKGTFYTLAALLLVYSLVRGRRWKRGSVSAQPIQLLARRYLNNNCALVIAEVEGRKFLLSQGSDRIELVTALDDINGSRARDQETPSLTLSPDVARKLPRVIHGSGHETA